jgi:hypothetical protein
MFLFKGTFCSVIEFAVGKDEEEALTNMWKHEEVNGFPFELEKISEVDGYKITVKKT